MCVTQIMKAYFWHICSLYYPMKDMYHFSGLLNISMRIGKYPFHIFFPDQQHFFIYFPFVLL
ncbi:hypothetical protein SAMN04488025_13114 [Planifilum fulgidum]|uniref:Uncharacterized protein n=1 Tax=Planifilum fulgidum TaxID=201973 RepID=A0A1I2RR90_9BACL|nr:hypothetical protein SAMN04488025_13114 [Planifilum fulgidum]